MDEPSPIFSLAEISLRTGIPGERIRYVVDQRLLPGRLEESWISEEETGSQGRGRARRYTRFEACCITCAALLLQAGLRRQTVKDVLKTACTVPNPLVGSLESTPLRTAFDQNRAPVLEIGDGCYVRLRGVYGESQTQVYLAWCHPTTGVRLAGYDPVVVVSLDIDKLRRKFR